LSSGQWFLSSNNPKSGAALLLLGVSLVAGSCDASAGCALASDDYLVLLDLAREMVPKSNPATTPTAMDARLMSACGSENCQSKNFAVTISAFCRATTATRPSNINPIISFIFI
jgi:hypothetical protein